MAQLLGSRPTLEDAHRRASLVLDELLREWSLGRPSQRRHDEIVERTEQLSIELRAAARGTGTPVSRPVNPPLWVSQDGRSAAW